MKIEFFNGYTYRVNVVCDTETKIFNFIEREVLKEIVVENFVGFDDSLEEIYEKVKVYAVEIDGRIKHVHEYNLKQNYLERY